MTATGTYTVVVVDDNPDDRAEIRRLLLRGSERRYRFVEAATGAAAVREVRALLAGNDRRPDGVVLDYALPDASALEVIAQLIDGAGVPPCPIVVLTGSVGSSEGASVLRAGAQDFLSKSGISAESLTRALENAMERYEMARELRERATALRYSEERFRLAAEAANALVYDVDLRPGGGVVAHGTERLVGVGGREPLAFTREWWRARIHPADRAGGLGSEASSLEVGDIYRAVYRVRHELGYWVDVQDTGQVVRDFSGAPERLVGAVVDVTAPKRAEAALRAADRQKDEFLAVLAHELRNPLAPIRTVVDLLRSGRVPADRRDHLLGVVDRQSAQLVRLVDDLMDVSRIRSGKVVLRRERVALGDAVVTAVESVQPLVSERRHRLSVTLPDEPLFVDGDLARITQILTNLLTNAAKYMDAGGQIWLDLRREERWAVARIRDTGMGIGRDVLPHVFRLFVQADQTRHRAQGGLGLGLGVVKRLVELHGGTVDAASDGPGPVSYTHLTLPTTERV